MSRSNAGPLPAPLPTPPRWQESLRDAVRNARELLEILEIDPDDISWLQPGANEFPILVPKSFVARMKKGDPQDPLLRQVLPGPEEHDEQQGFSTDPLGELALAHDGVIQKYPARALVVTTAACPVHCRYCFRRHFPYSSQAASRGNWSAALTKLRNRTGVREVILSGGDPLTLSNRRLRELISELEGIGSLTTIRIHSRFPIILPSRVDEELLELLSEARLKTVLVVHSNHANEIDESVRDALHRVRAAGAVLLNQSVLLRGINDEVDRLEALSYRLFDAGTIPYYLHQLDRVAGAAHFEVPAKRAVEIVTALRHRLPGYLVPRLVQELPGDLSKAPLVESHL